MADFGDVFQITSITGNRMARRAAHYPAAWQDVLDFATMAEAVSAVTGWPSYEPTPLLGLAGLARAVGVGKIWYKDESRRFGLGSFKALGGAYAVSRLRREQPDGELTVACATDGNHGRSVAWGSRMFGCRCVIYIHAGVSHSRQRAMEALGAMVVRVPGNYDDSVRQVAEDAARQGWIVVSDTSYPGCMEIPRHVMAGYTVLTQEIAQQLGHAPSHVIVQGGVGGLAAAVTADLWRRFGDHRPQITVVEPDRADCLYQSAMAGYPVTVVGALDTLMAGLACGAPSELAWRILSSGVDAFATISDSGVPAAMRLAARSPFGDPSIEAGESAVAGLVLLLAASARPGILSLLGLDHTSEVVLLGTEGATDLELYSQIVGA